ncbi:MAG: PQQ-dependent sugar dehydrogenase [Rhizomicrobium sp.]|jgi:glucose/arabinose dehydrogenase
MAMIWKTAGFAAVLLTGATAMAADVPGQHFSISPEQIPAPFATPAVDNSSQKIARPRGAMPVAPAGFTVSIFARVPHARLLAVAPNGDVFVAQSDLGKVIALRPSPDGTKAQQISTFASGFAQPHGIEFHTDVLWAEISGVPPRPVSHQSSAVYVADTKSLWRYSYRDGQLVARGKRLHVADTTPGGAVGHFTRDIAFGEGGDLFLTLGSKDNLAEDPPTYATVQQVGAGGQLSTFASGLRNPVGIAVYPSTGDLYVTVNERDGLGDNLPPDYFTRIQRDDFFGWPYAYTGTHPDPTFGAKRPDLVAKAKTPDVLFQPHSAPLGFVFYEGAQFPAEYKGDAFVCLHGSWNSSMPTGYKVVRIKFQNGRPQNGYDNFLTGFWDGSTSPAKVWGRPVWPAVAKDGSLLVSDDTGGIIWRVAFTGK